MAKPVKSFRLKEKLVPAVLWKRAIAYVIDIFIVNVIIMFPFQSMTKATQSSSIRESFRFFSQNVGVAQKVLLMGIVVMLMTILYWAVFEYRFGQTFGKLILKLQVRSVLKKDLTLAQCFLRSISKVSTLVLVIDCIPIIFRKSHQRYLEKSSGTEVVEKGWNM